MIPTQLVPKWIETSDFQATFILLVALTPLTILTYLAIKLLAYLFTPSLQRFTIKVAPPKGTL